MNTKAIAALLGTLAASVQADPTIHGHNGTATGVDLPGNGAYTIRHWESGQTYQRNTTQGRTVTVPHTDGTLIVANERGYRVALSDIDPGWSGDADEWATVEKIDRIDRQIHATADDLRQWSQNNGVRLDRHDVTLDHNDRRISENAAGIGRNSARLDKHAAGIAGTAALASHSLSGPGLRVSVSGAEFSGHSAVSTAVGFAGPSVAVSVRAARSGDETVYGGAVEWRVW